ncbi:hypothetical protein SAMN03159341_1435 [Paenibacillus sp. 1_12]|uniref:hypothetical protein n=1 Tax=Paenibacillus sp. 1_12 TaxID=1566278 RepID=UPI0008E436C9|nr:hypothetical protein [Paenibacillus sp. 1_12]SFM52732.1 hypothetical protein SAMN03159341_1435 [Paenibacillus sp. 1_12]
MHNQSKSLRKALREQSEVELNKNVWGYTLSSKSNTFFLSLGLDILDQMDSTQQDSLGSKSGMLHFVNLLGTSSRIFRRDIPTAVGVTLYCDEDICVPVIDMNLNKKTGIDASKDIAFRQVKAREKFALSLYEFMFLVIKDEYAGFIEANGNPRGAYLSVKSPAFFKGKTKLPTPTITFRYGSGPIKYHFVVIDEQSSFDGKWFVKKGFKRFAELIPKRKQHLLNKVTTIINENQKLKSKNLILQRENVNLNNCFAEFVRILET